MNRYLKTAARDCSLLRQMSRSVWSACGLPPLYHLSYGTTHRLTFTHAPPTNLNRVAVVDCSRGFQPTDWNAQKQFRRVATIEPEDRP